MKKTSTQESQEIIKFVKLVAIVIVVILGIYFASRIFITKDLFNKDGDDTTEKASVNYKVISLGSLFNRPFDEYYVLAYDSKDLYASFYSTLVSVYDSKEDGIKIYSADLNNTFNKSFLGEESTPSATSASELKLKGVTLIKVSKGKIVKFIEDKEEMTKELKINE